MSKNIPLKIRRFLDSNLGVAFVFVLVSLITFGIGRLSVAESSANQIVISPLFEVTKTDEIVVGSINGSKYHYPWCGGAARIKPQNLIEFDSIEDAKNNGYSPAKNCKGLK